jgi:hypothetical protein
MALFSLVRRRRHACHEYVHCASVAALVEHLISFLAGKSGAYYPPEEQQPPKVHPAQPIRSQ